MSAPLVETAHGRVRGRAHDDMLRFDGIPFAAPPLGPLRFAPPAPVRPWPGVRAADTPPPAPPQRRGAPLATRPVDATAEDCLYLNVATPGLHGRRPVMVWIQGGGFVSGAGADPLHRGTGLVPTGDVVLVTFNYRLGLLGFLHPDPAAGFANAALGDQLAALGWVRENIAAFGGDPDRVTLFGESAGAMSVVSLLDVPEADGLFHRAIIQSGATDAGSSTDRSARVVAEVAEALGSADLRRWQTVPVDHLLDIQERVAERVRAETGRSAFRHLTEAPGVDGRRPADRRPVIVGTNGDEQRLFLNVRRALDRPTARRRLARSLAARVENAEAAAETVLAGYTRLYPADSEVERLARAETELHYRLPALRLAHRRHALAAPVWNYLFTQPSPALRGRLGACHALEVPFVFGTLDAPGMARFAGDGPEARAVSARVIAAWSAFAHGADPRDVDPPAPRSDGSRATSGAALWLPWEPDHRRAWQIEAADAVVAAPREDERRLWQRVLGDLVS